jgi:hypothetical protein
LATAADDIANLKSYKDALQQQLRAATDPANRASLSEQISRADSQIASTNNAIRVGLMAINGGNFDISTMTDAEIVAMGFAFDAIGAASIRGAEQVNELIATAKLKAQAERAKQQQEGANGEVAPGELTGTRTAINSADDAATVRSLTRENESATTLAKNGYKVQQNPPTLPNGKNPDYIINGEVFDNYAPSTSRVRNAWSEIEDKVLRGQTNNVVVNLADTSITPAALKEQLINYPIPSLKQVIIIDKLGTPTVVKIGGN